MNQRTINKVVEPSREVSIYLAGDLQLIRQTCMEYVSLAGLCVTVTPTEFIYSGGQETGAKIGLINYPRFPSEEDKLMFIAESLAKRLIEKTYQETATIVGPTDTIWLTRRKEDQ